MVVLKEITRACKDQFQPRENLSSQASVDHQMVVPPPRQQGQASALNLELLCIVTAFELLSGQGEYTLLLV